MNAESKIILRKQILQVRNQMSDIVLAKKSLRIQDNILNSEAYKNADRVFLFLSMPKEVDTQALIKQAWLDNKKVMVPIAQKGEKMFFVQYEPEDILIKSKFGVMEPQKNAAQEELPQKKDLFLVPGVVFDRNGGRIGYGGGFYDRYFAQNECYLKIGIAFSFQVMNEKIMLDEFDIPIDKIVTEEEWIGGNEK